MQQRVWGRRLPAVVGLALGLAGAALAGTGDINGDGKVTSADAALALAFAGGIQKPTTAKVIAGDVWPDAPDGRITLADATRIARLATGLQPPLPGNPIELVTTMTVSGNATRNFTLPGGYSISGRLTDTSATAFTGGIAFQDTTTSDVFGPFALDASGNYTALLPAGTYQAAAVTEQSTTDISGGTLVTHSAVAVGQPFIVSGTVTGKNFQRGTLPASYSATFTFTGSGAPLFVPDDVLLTDAGTTSATFGMNDADQTSPMSGAAGPVTVSRVPAGTYDVEVHGTLTVGVVSERAFLYPDAALPVQKNTSLAVTVPAMYTLSGALTGAGTANLTNIYIAQVYQPGVDVFEASIDPFTNLGGYQIAAPKGSFILTFGSTSTDGNTETDFNLPVTMPAGNLTKNVSIPAPPTFRTIMGKVYGPSGAALANATIVADGTLATIPTAGAYTVTEAATTDSTGSYTLSIPDGTYDVTITPA